MHDEANELLALYALGALDGDELALVESHLAEGCAECLVTLAGFERTVSIIPFALAPEAPPAGLAGRLARSIGEHGPTRAAGQPPIPFTPRADGAQKRSVVGPLAAVGLLATAAAIVIAFLVVSLLSARDRLDTAVRELASAREASERQSEALAERERLLDAIRAPETRTVRLAAPGSRPEPTIDVYWRPDRSTGVLLARNLPATPENKTYELWLIAGAAPIPAGTFDADANGNAFVELPKLVPGGAPQKFAVTVEPEGGSPAPTSDIVFVGDYGA